MSFDGLFVTTVDGMSATGMRGAGYVVELTSAFLSSANRQTLASG